MKRKLFLLLCALLTMIGVQAETDYSGLMSTNWTNSSGDFQGGKERYQNANYGADKIMYQSFTAPATGIYEIKFYAVTSSTSGRGFDNIYGPNIAQAYATAGSNKSTVAMEVIDQTGCTLVADANIRTLSIEATEGETIEYGLENIATGGNWYTILKYSAKMKTVAEIFQAQYDEAYNVWQYSTESEDGARATFKSYVDALYTAMSGTLAEAQTASDNLAAQQAIYETKSYPVKGHGVKYDYTSRMNMAINAWTCKQGNGPAQYGFTGATETYGGTSAGEVMYQTITGLPSGEYEIHFYAVANAANSGGVPATAEEEKAFVYANDQVINIPVIEQSSCTPSDYERTLTVAVTDGQIKYGMSNNDAAGNWYLAKNVALYLTGAPDLSEFYQMIEEKLDAANGLVSEPMNSEVLSDLQDAISGAAGYESITVIPTLESIANQLTTAIGAAYTSVANYAEALTILDAANGYDAAGQASYAADETIAAIQTAYDNRSLVSVSNEQKVAAQAALVTACKAQEQPADGCDMTAVIVNPNIDGNVEGWTCYINANGGYTGGPLKPSNDAMEFWAAGTQTEQDHGKSFDYHQEISDLPTGAYTISAQMLNSTNGEEGANWNGGGTSGLYGKTASAEVQKLITVDSENYDLYTTSEIFVVDGELRIGVKNITAMTGRWFAATGFKLTYARQLTDEEKIEIAKAELNAILTSTEDIIDAAANVGDGVFQIPASALSTLSDAKDDAQAVYDDPEATEGDVLQAIDDLKAANTAYSNVTLNTPEAGKRYCIVLKYSGYEYDGKAMTYMPYDRPDMGLYNIKYQAEPNANYAQAFILTQVEGNTYKMSQTDGDGNTRYICTGVPYSGNTSQIRTTTTADDALVVEIRATATDGVFNIFNTEANNYIGSQDAGVFTVNSHIDFTIQEAEKASAKMVISAIAKMGTFCAPFNVEIPENVKAYTVTKESGKDYVTLTDVEDEYIPAGTPVLVEYTGSGVDPINVTFENYATVNECDNTGVFQGVFEKKNELSGDDNYILQYQGGVCAFYLVDSNDIYVGANRCYLHLESGETLARIAIGGEDDPTAINAINAADAESEGLKDGKYFIEGKIVIVKNAVKYSANGQILK